MTPQARPRPVFIHAFWRTSSTYIWRKFREQPQYRAYYEPFSERLTKPKEQLVAETPAGRVAQLRHPPIDDFYFAEFPFTEDGRVEFFEKRFSYETYCLDETADDEALRRYISNLIEHAGRRGRQPVLQFNRSLFRAGWLRRNFPNSVNILLVRRPADVWKSVLSFTELSFVGVFCIVLGQNRAKAPLKFLPEWICIPAYAGATIEDDYVFYKPLTIQNAPKLYPMFYDFFVAATLYAAKFADCVLDMDEISTNASARQRAEDGLRECGLPIRLGDCSLPSNPPAGPQEREWLAYEEFARTFLPHFLPRSVSLPYERFLTHRPMLGEYFRNLLLEFTERASRGALRISEIAFSGAAANHAEGMHLLRGRRPQLAARKFAHALRGKPASELWNDWAVAQLQCGHSLLAELGYRQAREAASPRRAATPSCAPGS